MTEALHMKHNRELAVAYVKNHGPHSRYPKVSEQIQTIPIETELLFPFGYNPTLTFWGGKMMLCYRYHEGTLATKLALANIHESGKVISNEALAISGESVEDPKWFEHNHHLHLSWVNSTWPQNPPTCVVRFKRFDTDDPVIQPTIGRNDGTSTEKNWVFFEHDYRLFCLHQCFPVHRVFQLEGNEVSQPMATPGPRWPYGTIKGGTCPLPLNGKLLRFFHSTMDNEYGRQVRRYYIGAYLMEPNPPFSVVTVSKKPIIYGSEIDSLKPAQRRSCIHYKENVVFPGGAIESDGYWILALGTNDSACVLAKIRESQLNF